VGDFEGTVSAVLSELAGGAPVAVAHGFDGRSCPSATLRVIRGGGEIGIHVDNAYLHMPHTEHLRALVDPLGQLSYFLTLAVPDDGGSVEVIGLEWAAARLFMGQPAGEQANVWYRGSDVWKALEGFGYTGVRPEPGDLLVFDGGRYFHRVSTVHGTRPRCTIGGFLGMTTGRDRVYIWS
jgi:hypothetical protein